MSGHVSNAVAAETWHREAMRVLPHMRHGPRYLALLDADRRADEFALFDHRRKSGRPVLKVAQAMVQMFFAHELIGSHQDCAMFSRTDQFVLTELGHAFVARGLSTHAPHADQHRQMVSLEDTKAQQPPAKLNLLESPLLWLSARRGADGGRYLAAEEVQAGERLRDDFTRARMAAQPTSHWPLERVDTSRRTDYSMAYDLDTAQQARHCFWRAVNALGSDLAPAVVAVCCYLEGLEAVERKMSWPRRSGKAMLKLGLRQLAVHYGMVAPAAVGDVLRTMNMGDVPAD